MIVRNYLKCDACGAVITTRTAVGHGTYQEFAFPCTECGIEIRFGMDIDQEKHSFQYTKIINAKWTKAPCSSSEMDFSAESTVVLDSESLIPILGEFFSPFMATTFLPKDPEQFRLAQSRRFSFTQNIWPMIEKLIIHEGNRNKELYDAQKSELGYQDECHTWKDRILLTLRILEKYGRVFRPTHRKSDDLIRQRINLSDVASPNLIRDLIRYLNTTGKTTDLFLEIISIRKRWAYLYPMLSPIYNIFYWSEEGNSLDIYTLAEKRFEDLKPFFVDCFETLCRISLIASAIEGIIWCKSLVVPTSKKPMRLQKFDEMPNGSKPDILRNMVIGDLFVPYMDNKLRNGIGHHSARYDVNNDAIEYSYKTKKGTQLEIISYIRFCEKVVRLYVQIELLSIYVHWVTAKAEGIKGKIV